MSHKIVIKVEEDKSKSIIGVLDNTEIIGIRISNNSAKLMFNSCLPTNFEKAKEFMRAYNEVMNKATSEITQAGPITSFTLSSKS